MIRDKGCFDYQDPLGTRTDDDVDGEDWEDGDEGVGEAMLATLLEEACVGPGWEEKESRIVEQWR